MLWPASSGAVRSARNSRCQVSETWPAGLRPNDGEVPESTSRFTSSGRRATTSCATMPPMLWPISVTPPHCRLSIRVAQLSARPLKVYGSIGALCP
jgi:hypothetical protein